MRTPRRTREMPGVQTRCMPRVDSTMRTSELKSARALAATKRSATISFLLMFVPLRNSEAAFERCEFVEIDRADDVHDRQLARLGGDDHHRRERIAVRQRVDLAVVAHFAFHRHDALPLGTDLAADGVEDRRVVLAVGV